MATRRVPRGTSDLNGTMTINNADDLAFLDGESNITAGYDLSTFDDAGTGGLTSLTFGEGATPIIKPEYALKVDVDQGAGLVHVASKSGQISLYPGGASGVFNRYRHCGAIQSTLMSGGKATLIEQSEGGLLVAGAVDTDEAHLCGGQSVIRYHANTIDELTISGGSHTLMRSVTLLEMAGGVLVVRPENAGTNVPVATTIRLYGGTLIWMGGDISSLRMLGSACILDMRGITQAVAVATMRIDAAAKRNPRNFFNGSNYAVTYGGSALSVWGDKNDAFPN